MYVSYLYKKSNYAQITHIRVQNQKKSVNYPPEIHTKAIHRQLLLNLFQCMWQHLKHAVDKNLKNYNLQFMFLKHQRP